MTADAFEDTREMCLQGGFDGWLPKPFRIEELTRVITQHARRRGGREGGPPHAGGQAVGRS